MGLRARLKNLERKAEREMLSFELEDGTIAKFPPGTYLECFMHESERGREHYFGEPVRDAHPLVKALRRAKDLGALMAQHGTLVGHWVGEDQIILGLRRRPGTPVRETSAGVYE
jgi:hypothetical protein